MRKSSGAASCAANDPPLVRCDYSVPGHQPHWIQVLRVAEFISDVRAVVGDAHPEGGVWITITFPDGHVESWWHHDRGHAATVLGTEQPCEWRTTGLLLVGARAVGVGIPTVCLSRRANVVARCPSSNDPHAPEPEA